MQEAGPAKEAEAIPAPDIVQAALQTAESQDPPAFDMNISCVDDREPRSLHVLRSGTSIWNRSTQIVVPPDALREYVKILKRADYPTMAKSYGGKKKGAQLIRCEITVDFGEVQKTSIQLVGGEQSPRVIGLARELLDYTESLGLPGEQAASLNEALKKGVAGQLNPDALTLRILQLPPTKGQDGLIVDVRGGEVLRRRYAPGRGVGGAMYKPLERPDLLEVLNALISADFENLPANLMADETVEVEVAMLGHRKKVIARQFGRAMPAETAQAQARFDRLLAVLRTFAGDIKDVQ